MNVPDDKPATKYVVYNCDETVVCGTLEEACDVAEGWFPDADGWTDLKLDPNTPVESINEQMRRAYGPGDHYEPACPVIRVWRGGRGWRPRRSGKGESSCPGSRP